MGNIFLKLLNMSMTASWLILAVLCIRLLFRKIPRWVACFLWGVVAVRLIFPFSIESALSLQPSAEPIRSSAIVEGKLMPYIPSVDSNIDVLEDTVNPFLAETFEYQEAESVAPLQVFTGIAGSVWLCGMVVLLIFALASMIKLRLCVREAVRYKENIYICDAVKSPFILGIIKPGIYLSSASNGEEMDYIIAHERAHLKRKDHLWKPFGYLLLCVYWFNPLCWIAYIMLCRDIELACDEKVIKDMSFGDKKEYSRVLLSCASQRRLVTVCPLAFGEVGVRERVKSVLNYKKPALWITILAIIVCIIVAICFLTNPQKEYSIRITIPAGSAEEIVYQEDFFYSDAEISPTGNKIIFSLGEGMGDTEVVLKPIEAKEENAYEPTDISPGMSVKMDVEKGAWFKIGVNMQNPTSEDIEVYVDVRNVEVRISEREEIEKNSNESAEDVSEWITEELNVEKRDITHDGVADYIVTSMTYDPAYMDENVALADKIEQQVMYDIVCVKVYEGSNTSDTYSEEQLLWSQEYSRVHVGNGQLSVVCKDDKDYILTSNLWAGQGVATWEFEVFSLNEMGDKKVIDKQTIEFELQEGIFADEESYAEFNHSLKGYINDGILIVACDIDFEQQLIRTQESPYIPWDYYSKAFVKLNNKVENEKEDNGYVWMSDKVFISEFKDLDGNGIKEYVEIDIGDESNDFYCHMKLYWNDAVIYEYDDPCRIDPGEAEYIDLDGDGEKEIFVSFAPRVNSMPLVEYIVLKQTGSSWEPLEMIHGGTMMDNAFPLSVTKGDSGWQAVISCKNLDKTVAFDVELHYLDLKRKLEYDLDNGEEREVTSRLLERYETEFIEYPLGESCGNVSAWGIWNIEVGEYEGHPCLIAAHGIQCYDKFDFWGETDVYFDYDENGNIRFLDIQFRPQNQYLEQTEDNGGVIV